MIGSGSECFLESYSMQKGIWYYQCELLQNLEYSLRSGSWLFEHSNIFLYLYFNLAY